MNFIDWSVIESNKFENSGEGGLFCYAVVRASKAVQKNECIVDCSAQLSDPNVQVGVSRSFEKEFWLEKENGTVSENLVAVVLLGSTSNSAYNLSRGEYFSVGFENLTSAGVELVNSLSLLGEVELLTFLDT